MLTGIAFVLETGIGWDDLPAELGWGCGKTCRQRLRTWQRLGIWDRIRAAILARLNQAGKIDWSHGSIDSGSVQSPGGGGMTGPNPTDRRKSVSKHHILVDGRGIPLAAMTTGANRDDSQAFVPPSDALEGVGGRPGLPIRFPGDRACDLKALRRASRGRRIRPRLAKRNAPYGSGLGVFRWPVERTIRWLHRFRRLGDRRDRLVPILEAFLTLG